MVVRIYLTLALTAIVASSLGCSASNPGASLENGAVKRSIFKRDIG